MKRIFEVSNVLGMSAKELMRKLRERGFNYPNSYHLVDEEDIIQKLALPVKEVKQEDRRAKTYTKEIIINGISIRREYQVE